jgi:SAM-dependent methyltransferase
MQGYEADTYGEKIADHYDELHSGAVLPTGSVEDAVAFLAEVAGGGRALELGVGTGRIAVPLAAAGVAVEGVDASPRMVAKLREKLGGDAIPVTIGDFTTLDGVEGPFDLVYVVFNTLFLLLTQDDQIACFRAVAARLAPGGAFVIEAFVPDLGLFDRGQRVSVRDIGLDSVFLEASKVEPASQTVVSQQLHFSDGGQLRMRPVTLRYAWPTELDLMARLAGLERAERWSTWTRAPFGGGSGAHVSVYRAATPRPGSPS